MPRMHVVSAIFWRNLAQYFSGVLGYLFIVVFVTLCALAAFNQQFFADNLATLDQLSRWFPWLLLFLTPAISMTVWADERRQGTDALLFTLPASDWEILWGKYLAVSAVYTVALFFSLTQLVALASLGQPDWGIVFTTYLGYWLAGLALLSIGMFASSLTDSPTVAFVLGAVLCALPVVIGNYFFGNAWLESCGIAWHLQDFNNGLISAPSVLYFFSIIAVFLYLNLIVISRRQWRARNTWGLWGRYLTRLAALLVILVSWNFIANSIATSQIARLDFTRQRAFTLDKATVDTLKGIQSAERGVSIQAFVSDEVPRDFVNVRKQFLGLLRQLKFFGGKNIEVNVVTVSANSEAAEQAEKTGIVPQDTNLELGGKQVQQKVYLGAYISSSLDNITIPQIKPDSSVEYELTRGLMATTNKDWQIRVGILDSDTHFGGFEFRGQRVPWLPYDKTLGQLRTFFEIVYINQDQLGNFVTRDPIPSSPEAAVAPESSDRQPPGQTPPDVLLVADPASLDDAATTALVQYLKDGNPTVLLMDPLPFFWTTREPKELGILNAPRQPRISPQSPYFQALGSSEMAKADLGTAARILATLGIEWDNGMAAWSLTNPHPNFAGFWPPTLGPAWPPYYGKFEYAFVYANRDSGARSSATSDAGTNSQTDTPTDQNSATETKATSLGATFNPQHPVSQYLNELLFFYPGEIRPVAEAKGLKFTPLVQLTRQAGVLPWEELTFRPTQSARTMNPVTRRIEVKAEPLTNPITDDDLIVVNPTPIASVDNRPHVLAAHIQQIPAPGSAESGSAESRGINAIVIADLDFVSEFYYEQQENLPNVSLDNFRLLQNAIEVLAQKDDLVALRNRRVTPATLTAFEQRIAKFREARVAAEETNKAEVDKRLASAQERLESSIKSIDEDQSSSFIEKLQMSSQETLDAQEKFNREQAKLEKELQRKSQSLKAQESRQVNELESWIRGLAVILAPLPALILGILVIWWRSANEARQVRPDRAVK